LQRAGMAISSLLGADVLAIGLLTESGGAVELAAVCRAGSETRSGPVFDVASQLPVHSAVSRQRALLVTPDQELQHATLAALIGGATGPLWIQPLVHQRETMGVLIAHRPAQRRPSGWTESEAQTLNGLCDVLASALSIERQTTALTQQLEELRQRAPEPPPAPVEPKRPGAQPAQAAPPLMTPLPASTFKRTSASELLRSARPPETARPAPTRSPGESQATRTLPSSEKTLRVSVKVDRDSPLKSVRAMMVLTQVKRIGRLIACQPVEADLRSGGFEDEFVVTFATSSTPEAVQDTLTSIRDVTSVNVQVA
jgi:chemotaxis protein histidine kinase CheA